MEKFNVLRTGSGIVYSDLKVIIKHNYNSDSGDFGKIINGKVKGYISKTVNDIKAKDILQNDTAEYTVLAIPYNGLNHQILILERSN